jgi:membrane-associated phospholipid phosphatase
MIKQRLSVLLLLSMLCVQKSSGQQVLHLKKPLIYFTAPISVGLATGGYWQVKKVQPFTTTQIQSLNRNTLSPFNQKTTYKYNHTATVLSDISVFASASIPALMSLSPRIRKQFVTYNTVYAQCLLATMGELMLIKSATRETRPYAYNPNVPLEKRLNSESKMSFPSMHTALSSAACFFVATTYCLYYPESKYKIPVWAGAILLPLVTGYLRNQSGSHFYKDIAVGYAIGAANGLAFPIIFKVGKK